MRLTALFPLLCSLIALVLALLCIFAGSKRGYLENANLLTVHATKKKLYFTDTFAAQRINAWSLVDQHFLLFIDTKLHRE